MIWLMEILKTLRDKAFTIAKSFKYNGYQRELASMVYKFFDKKSAGSGVNMDVKPNEKLAKELHKPMISKIKKELFILNLKIIFGVLI